MKKWCVSLLTALLLLGLAASPALAAEVNADDREDIYSAETMKENSAVMEELENDSVTTEGLEADTLAVDGDEESQETADDSQTDGEDGDLPEESSVKIMVSKSELTLQYIDSGETLTYTIADAVSGQEIADDAGYSVQWSSSNEEVAIVDQDGNIQAVNNGTVTITVSVYSEESEEIVLASDECAVTVKLYTGIRTDVTGKTDTIYYYKNGEVYSSDEGKATVQKDSDNVVDKTTVYWWYVDSDGKVDKTYTGYAENQNGWWYIENGIVTFKKNSVIKDKNINGESVIDGNASWWYVTGSKVRTDFTGLADYSNENGWWYIENGKVTFTKNTVAKNKNGWWYVTGSKVQFGFTGLANYSNENGWWYIKNGKVDFTKNTVAKNKNGWWYVTGGKVQFGFTGLANYSNENGWWYIKNGKVDFTYTGIAKNKNGYWYVNGGKVIFEDALTYAARFVADHSTEGASSYVRLSECYDYIQSIYSYKRYYGIPTSSDLFSYAKDYFVNKTGNCYRYASSFACIAKVLGFESRMVSGKISSSSGGWTSHGWAEVKYNGTWYICDMNFKVFMKTESGHPRNLKILNRYTLTVSNGKATWK